MFLIFPDSIEPFLDYIFDFVQSLKNFLHVMCRFSTSKMYFQDKRIRFLDKINHF